MKTSIFLYPLVVWLATFISPELKPAKTSLDLARQVVIAFQHESVEEYNALFPSVIDFDQLLTENKKLYGQQLPDAKAELERQYIHQLVPGMRTAFYSVLNEGTKRGIVWSEIEFAKADVLETNERTLYILFKHKQKSYQLQIEKIFQVNGEWKVTHFIKLI